MFVDVARQRERRTIIALGKAKRQTMVQNEMGKYLSHAWASDMGQ
jgi:hypothetical protein